MTSQPQGFTTPGELHTDMTDSVVDETALTFDPEYTITGMTTNTTQLGNRAVRFGVHSLYRSQFFGPPVLS